MIDNTGFRINVGIILLNDRDEVFWGKRVGRDDIWQFPQGGIQEGERAIDALFRELYEEVGLKASDVEVIAESQGWLSYRFIPPIVKTEHNNVYIGQKQRYFVLRLKSGEDSINLKLSNSPEFSAWRWVSYWYPIVGGVSFKQPVYRQALAEFAKLLF